MAGIRQLSFEEKYVMARNAEERIRKVIIPFAEEHLGDRHIRRLKRRWEAGSQQIPRDATPEEQYEIAYANWISTLQSSYTFIREMMGDKGVEMLRQGQIEALEHEKVSKAPFYFGLYKSLAPSAAFRKTASRLVHEMQWFTPFEVQELSDRKAVLNVAKCKILQHEDAGDVCEIACRQVYPTWAASEFGISMKLQRHNGGCVATLERM